MNGYFKPLRRKLGVLTLVVACVFVAGWVRSRKVFDEAFCAINEITAILVISCGGSLTVAIDSDFSKSKQRKPATELQANE